MLHEDPQRDVVGVDLRPRAAVQVGVVGRGGVQPCHQETGLRLVLIADHKPRNGRAGIHDQTRVGLGCLQELSEGRVLLAFLVALLAPRSDGFSVEDDDLKEGVQQQDDVRSDAVGIQQDGLGRTVEAVGQKGGLDHDQRIGGVLLEEIVAVPGCLIGTGIEDVQELGSSQVEHKLWVHAEFRRQAEAARIVGPVFGEFGAQPNQRPIDPSEDVGDLVRVGLVDCQSSR
mmetsp:Transcript_927/g.2036  ORF Transcript_927/g.2036 Transcript_927/m.2036 type:complete len:229 (+) Transcript_927:2708-3394(+)